MFGYNVWNSEKTVFDKKEMRMIYMINRDTVLWLSSIDMIGPKTMKKIFDFCGSPEKLHETDIENLRGVIKDEVIDKIKKSDFEKETKAYKARPGSDLSHYGIRIIRRGLNIYRISLISCFTEVTLPSLHPSIL